MESLRDNYSDAIDKEINEAMQRLTDPTFLLANDEAFCKKIEDNLYYVFREQYLLIIHSHDKLILH